MDPNTKQANSVIKSLTQDISPNWCQKNFKINNKQDFSYKKLSSFVSLLK